MDTPRGLGYRLPAEWEPQDGVWLSWPTHRDLWPGCWAEVEKTFAEIALKLSQTEPVFINLVVAQRMEVEVVIQTAERELALTRGELKFFDHPVDDVWVRDHGPIYLRHRQTGSLALTNWDFNGWGEKYPYALDNKVPRLIAKEAGLPCFDQSLVLEGGSIETNGVGDLLVTTDCLLNQNRNPGLSREAIGQSLKSGLGVDKVHWLDGCIEGDDTDGHIDNLVRFFKPDGLLVGASSDPNDPNYAMLKRLNQQCLELISVSGNSFEVIPVPLPPASFKDGCRLPMSYLNFFIANGLVLIPAFGQPEPDNELRQLLAGLYPDRQIVPVDCQKLILEGGALHCLTQQVPQSMN